MWSYLTKIFKRKVKNVINSIHFFLNKYILINLFFYFSRYKWRKYKKYSTWAFARSFENFENSIGEVSRTAVHRNAFEGSEPYSSRSKFVSTLTFNLIIMTNCIFEQHLPTSNHYPLTCNKLFLEFTNILAVLSYYLRVRFWFICRKILTVEFTIRFPLNKTVTLLNLVILIEYWILLNTERLNYFDYNGLKKSVLFNTGI